MTTELAYGKGKLRVEFEGLHVEVIEPDHRPGIADERAALLTALDNPIGAEPLSRWMMPGQRICVTFTDLTRATPNERIIPVLLDYLERHGARKEAIVLLNQLGTHRPNTDEELEQMLTPEVVRSYRVVNHEPENERALVQVGVMDDGTPALINREYVESELRIVTGFIEPHLFAGFSGGPKNVMPGIAGLETIKSNHGYRHIADPNATFGKTHDNPVWAEMRRIAVQAGKAFLVNVTLNNDRELTGVFAGDLLKSHEAGCAFVRDAAMQRVGEPYDIVVTTNSGYPLDLNLYQTAKGIGAAARIVREGGVIIVASECREGVPSDSAFDRLLRGASGPADLLRKLDAAGKSLPDQWQAQIQANCQLAARILLYSSMSDEAVRSVHLEPCHDIAGAVREAAAGRSTPPRVAVLPYGPLTIPYLAPKGSK
jgi:nickel-dependent lactate racemase